MRPLLISLAAAVVAATVTLACGQDEEAVPSEPTATPTGEATPAGVWTAPSGTPVPKPGWKAIRFLNVTVSVSDGVVASRMEGYPITATEDYNRPVIVIGPSGDEYVNVVIDAKTGTVVGEAGSEQQRAALQPALDTVRISPFDPKDAPWPYSAGGIPGLRGGWGG